MNSPYLEIKNLRKIWKSENTTKEINFSLSAEKGSMTAIIGPSGCGKSTILKMIAGLIPVDSSSQETKLILDGKNLLPLKAGQRDVGMILQSPSLFPHLRVDDNIAYGLRCRGMNKKESRKLASEFLERINLSGFETRKPESLSGGEAQRVALARTLIIQPKLILFDEPLSALDESLRKKMAQDILTMQKETGFTGIFVTHDKKEAEFIANEIINLTE